MNFQRAEGLKIKIPALAGILLIYFIVAVIKTYDRNMTRLRKAIAKTIVTAVFWTLPPLGDCVPATGFI